MIEEMGSLGAVEAKLEAKGVAQETCEVGELQKVQATKRIWEKNMEQEVTFLLGLTIKIMRMECRQKLDDSKWC